MTTKNPFPGMNPFFEQQWRDAHTMLIAYLRDALQERLPQDLIARAEEETIITFDASEQATPYRPDVQVREPWTLKESDTAEVAARPRRSRPPIRSSWTKTERWIEIARPPAG
ncbi:MAG: DUF4058 family protein [Verrucomicrobiales bacterium]|nr:DUF4058 family protein [Verrucomicrobiales bacterium]